MFCIVRTLEEGEVMVTAVPYSWIRDDKILLWPKKKNEQMKGRKNCIDPQKEWAQYECEIICKNIGKK